jgi:BirA family biotin operon repressor/biotin-[acetyl-CoA-carboxylase] ligase
MPEAGATRRAGRDAARVARLRAALAPMRVCAYARLRSTQQKAIEELDAGRLAAPAVLVAARQTAGRGRRANRWWSDAGTLCATFLLPAVEGNRLSSIKNDVDNTGPTPYPAGQVPLRAGLAVAEVVARWLPRAAVQVKWPNDVLVDGRKIAGVLCERRRGCDIVGIGLNVSTDLRRMPPDVRRRATSLRRHLRRPPSREHALVEIARALVRDLARTDFEAAYRRRCVFTGRAIRVRAYDRWSSGLCRGIDEEGRLLVETPSGLLRLTDTEQIDS